MTAKPLFNTILLDGKTTEYPVIPIKEEDILDTNGAGDAFVGGEKLLYSGRFYIVNFHCKSIQKKYAVINIYWPEK